MNARQSGFTLIEVLVALAILALSLVAVIGAAGSSTRLSSGLRDRTFADWVALNELTTLRLAHTAPSDNSLNGDADMGDQKWHWTAKIGPTADPNLLRIDVDVANADKPDEVVESVTGFMGTDQSTGGPAP
ncbi:MAG TPA: type II secretion system minor pseudopilin GspI [Gammaproteobacteria bacterium]|nr:type II secretion system minor pseudopilin GspI [Gammaproteobacteria bacterium]